MNIKRENGQISTAFIGLGISTFSNACEWVRSLPYHRNSTKSDALIVLKERCGTCSSKHQVLKRLADEIGYDQCKLILCIFKMNRVNTPKVEPILTQYRLDYIPEAHTYLSIDGVVNDFTFPEKPELHFLLDVLSTEEIEAVQITTYKEVRHKAYLEEWGREQGITYTFEKLWEIREECIQALAKKD